MTKFIPEIGAKIFEPHHKKYLEDFHSYVRPDFELSRKYEEKFKVNKYDYMDDSPLSSALQKLDSWIERNASKYDFQMVTDGDNRPPNAAYICTWKSRSLSTILPNDAKKKQITYPKYLENWIDIRAAVDVSVECSFSCS